MLQRASLIVLTSLVMAGCGSDSPGAATGASSAPTAPEEITCDTHYREVREGILGALRGTESLPLIGLATRYSEAVLSAPAAGTTPAEMNCRSESRSLRGDRKPNTGTGWTLAPQCEALLQRLDTVCLQPLVEQGTPFSGSCNLALMGVASASGGQQANMSNAGLCESAMREL